MTFSIQSVLDHFGLARRPFAAAPDPAFLFPSEHHTRALSVMDYGLAARAPIIMLTGDVGVGKSLILRDVLSHPADGVQFAKLPNTVPEDRIELLRLILFALNLEAPGARCYATLYAVFEGHLIDTYKAGGRVVLVVDEAQGMSRATLEQLRMLTNVNYGDHELVQLVLAGQTELHDVVMRPDLRALAQRIGAKAHITPLSVDEVGRYMAYRLDVAGAPGPLFAADTPDIAFEHSGGVPRLINQICDFALFYAYGDGAHTVSRDHLAAVIEDDFVLGVAQSPPLRAVAQ